MNVLLKSLLTEPVAGRHAAFRIPDWAITTFSLIALDLGI